MQKFSMSGLCLRLTLLLFFFHHFYNFNSTLFLNFWQWCHNKILFAQPWPIPQLTYSVFKRNDFTFSYEYQWYFFFFFFFVITWKMFLDWEEFWVSESFNSYRMISADMHHIEEGRAEYEFLLNNIRTLLRFSNEAELKKYFIL